MGWMLLLFILSAVPGTQYPKVRYEDADKIVHLVLYTPLGFLLMRWFNRGRAIAPALTAIVVGMLYGASDELHQAFVPFRSASVADWITDSIGIVLGALWYCLYARRSPLPPDVQQVQQAQESA